VEKEALLESRVLHQMVDASRVKLRGASNDPMDLIPFREEKFGEIRAILASDSSN
jgi:hypothetical protein